MTAERIQDIEIKPVRWFILKLAADPDRRYKPSCAYRSSLIGLIKQEPVLSGLPVEPVI